MARSRSNTRQAVVDMAAALRPVFNDYTRDTRKRAWKKLMSPRGKHAMDELLWRPQIPLNKFRNLSFSEWLTLQENQKGGNNCSNLILKDL